MKRCLLTSAILVLMMLPFAVSGQQTDTSRQAVSDSAQEAKPPASVEVGCFMLFTILESAIPESITGYGIC